MPIRPNGYQELPEPPKTKRRGNAPEGGSPRGWSFISDWYKCQRLWMFKHLIGLVSTVPRKGTDPRRLGSAYHGLLEGRSKEELLEKYPDVMEEAVKHYTARMRSRVPIPEAEVVEEVVRIFAGKMTSKPDRIEKTLNGKPVVRDYKTSAFFSEYDDLTWGVDGGILGECIAAGASTAIVDIQRKWDNAREASPNANTKLVTVRLTPQKEEALRLMVDDFWDAVEGAMRRAKTQGAEPFRKNLTGCVGKYGPCPYYARCWGGAPTEALAYRDSERMALGLTEEKTMKVVAQKAAAGVRRVGIP
jgi:hypothetical protein